MERLPFTFVEKNRISLYKINKNQINKSTFFQNSVLLGDAITPKQQT